MRSLIIALLVLAGCSRSAPHLQVAPADARGFGQIYPQLRDPADTLIPSTRGLPVCSAVAATDTAGWHSTGVPWPSPRQGPLHVFLPPTFQARLKAPSASPSATWAHAVGIWFGPRDTLAGATTNVRTFLTISVGPEGRYPTIGIEGFGIQAGLSECQAAGRARVGRIATFSVRSEGNSQATYLAAYWPGDSGAWVHAFAEVITPVDSLALLRTLQLAIILDN